MSAQMKILTLSLLIASLTGCNNDKTTSHGKQTHIDQTAEIHSDDAATAHKTEKIIDATRVSTSEELSAQNKVNQVRMDNFQLPEKTKLTLWADSTQTQNPAYFSFDTQGRLLVAEIARINKGGNDIRFIPEMTIEDIVSKTTEDRYKMYQNHPGTYPMSFYTEKTDQVRLLADQDGDGRAESSSIFATGFNDVLDGLGSGVIERDGKVYYANIPHLWMLEDNNNDGVAEKRTSLQDGFGVRMSFFGHDMHGFAWGPDGKLYWTIGDRGYNLTTKEGKTLIGLGQGAVFRANADGSNIEVFYHTLRNPQELAFDDYGNLYTADNDGDGGDFERVNYIVEGGESGWHHGHQNIISFAERLHLRSVKYAADKKLANAWLAQDIWKVRNDNQPAYILPAIGQLAGGPSGLSYNPSSSFGPSWENNFFVVHYQGAPAKSFISAFKVEEQGAGFSMTDYREFIRGFNATDIDFGPDGRFYISEFNTTGWESQDSGAIYALEYTGEQDQTLIEENRTLLTQAYTDKPVSELAKLLERDHQHIRLRAQFELAKRGDQGRDVFNALANNKNAPLLARLHGIWGLGQITTDNALSVNTLDSLKELAQHDPDAQVRIQAVRVLGDHKVKSAAPLFIAALTDAHPRVAMYAAIALGRIAHAAAVPNIIKTIASNGDKDLFLRHGLVMALSGIAKENWYEYKTHASSHVRLAVLLVLRKHHDSDIAFFLKDKNQGIVNEAVAAINDLQIISARQSAAEHLQQYIGAPAKRFPDNKVARFHQHRLINLNYDLGNVASAQRLLKYASNPTLPARLQSEALAALEAWHDLNPIDNTTGLPSTANAERAEIKNLVTQYLPTFLKIMKDHTLVQSMRLAQANNYRIDDNILIAAVNNTEIDNEVRNQALQTLHARNDSSVSSLASSLLGDKNASVRANALKVLISSNADAGIKAAIQFARSKNTADHQSALKAMGTVPSPEIDKLIAQQLKMLATKQLNKSVILELLDAAKVRTSAEVAALLNAHNERVAQEGIMSQYQGSLEGGNAVKGRELFMTKGSVQCVRCHKIGMNGGDAGPALTRIADDYGAYHLLQAIVDPGAFIAPGYGSMVITDATGQKLAGIFMGEDDTNIRLKLDDQIKSFEKVTLQDIQRPISGMPPMGSLLSPYEVRDIVSFLMSRKSRKKQAPKAGH